MPTATGKWGDGGTWGVLPSADPHPFWDSPADEFIRREALFDQGTITHMAVRIKFEGASRFEPTITNLAIFAKDQTGQQLHTHEALIDATVGAVALRVVRTGDSSNDFVLSRAQLLIQQEKQRPKG